MKYISKDNIGFFILGIAGGISSPLLSSTLYAKFFEYNISNSIIGLFVILKTIYGLRFFLSPFVGRFRVPFISKYISKDRSEVLLYLILISLFILLLGFLNPENNLILLLIVTGILLILTTLLDTAFDVYRINNISDDQQINSTAFANTGYRIGNIVSGGLLLILVDYLNKANPGLNSWGVSYSIASLLLMFSFFATFLIKEKESIENKINKFSIKNDFIDPIKNLIINNKNYFLIFSSLALYKVGDAFSGTLLSPFLLEMDFTLGQIGMATKTVGVVFTICGGFFASLFLNKYSRIQGLLIAAILQMVTNFPFFMPLFYGNNVKILYFIIGFENFAQGIGYTALISYISSICMKNQHLKTQYTFLISLPFIGEYFIASSSGLIVDYFGWKTLFSMGVFGCIPSIIMFQLLIDRNEKI